MTAPILLTGFLPIGEDAVDSSALLMDRLAGEPGVVAALLPPLYDACGDAFAALLDEHQPAAALCFAVSADSDSVQIERLAWNRDESERADAAGTVRTDQTIADDGPTAYGSTLPLPRVMRELAMAGVPVTFSDFAGGFLGNHLFYRARHAIESADLDVPMGFFHLPLLPEQATGVPGRLGMGLERQELAVRTLAVMLRDALAPRT
ncbi:pyrrolidone-carboxylate peptidase [Azospirillum griseum]|uniref:Pyrrolidone-carboxylate peptidase n=1 Tax=Azospirillum griseum TaxID=2496639 RepID=A0A3S0KCE1_9PROT|nr:pyrrolidone-carboxylate peptidase [Azospirillum griseum]RTR21993.1 pyrrolidone-carboxylate peptidase [Azospirillum griseum]